MQLVRAVLKSLMWGELMTSFKKCALGKMDFWCLGFNLGHRYVHPLIKKTAAIET